jgi:hypothetical protein
MQAVRHCMAALTSGMLLDWPRDDHYLGLFWAELEVLLNPTQHTERSADAVPC